MPVSENPFLQIYGAWNVYHCESCDNNFAIDSERDEAVFVHCPICGKFSDVKEIGQDFIER